MSGLFGGGSSSSSQASNSTTVNVEVPLTIDTAGLQRALDALAGATASGQDAVAGAVTSSALISASALAGVGQSLKAGLQSLAEQNGGGQTAIVVAVIGFVGVLIAAKVIKLKGVKL